MKEERLIIVFSYIAGLLISFFFLMPVIFMITVSLSKNPDFLAHAIDFNPTIDNYYQIISKRSLHFTDYLLNSIIVSMLTTVFCLIIAVFAAYAITRLNILGKTFILFFILATSMFPQISLVGFLFKIIAKFGWINTYQALVLPYIAWSLPLALWIITSYFAMLPKEIDKAALVDGCSAWQVLYKIILPIGMPGLLSTALLVFIFSFNEFMFALMFSTDFKTRTIPVGIALFEGLHGEIPWGVIMSASTLAILPVVIITIIFQKQIIQGLTQGAVKG